MLFNLRKQGRNPSVAINIQYARDQRSSGILSSSVFIVYKETFVMNAHQSHLRVLIESWFSFVKHI